MHANLTPEGIAAIADELRSILDDIDDGELEATSVATARIEGAASALEALGGGAPSPRLQQAREQVIDFLLQRHEALSGKLEDLSFKIWEEEWNDS